jgi:drug/metabolite transporter (DMT)-like permease
MYSQNDLDEAVAAGALSADSANALRSFVEGQRSLPGVDEEHFRLITGFNDIFVAIASAILLFAVGWIGQSIGVSMGLALDDAVGDGPSFLAPAFVAATAWGLALFFTAKRRMALPSILLLLAFVGGVFVSTGFALATITGEPPSDQEALYAGFIASTAGLVAAGAAWLHWRRFKVPITIAAGAGAVAAIVVGLVIAAIGGEVEQSKNLILGVVLMLGIGVFLFAMRWDSSDPQRVTRRSDVAFWLHLLAAPMIVHPIFTLLGLNDGNATIGEGLIVVAVYVVMGLTALAIDRRALLVSALAYVLFALTELFKQLGAVELNVALTALVIGSALLLLSAYWHQARKLVVERLPDALQAKLPHLDRIVSPQPAA